MAGAAHGRQRAVGSAELGLGTASTRPCVSAQWAVHGQRTATGQRTVGSARPALGHGSAHGQHMPGDEGGWFCWLTWMGSRPLMMLDRVGEQNLNRNPTTRAQVRPCECVRVRVCVCVKQELFATLDLRSFAAPRPSHLSQPVCFTAWHTHRGAPRASTQGQRRWRRWVRRRVVRATRQPRCGRHARDIEPLRRPRTGTCRSGRAGGRRRRACTCGGGSSHAAAAWR